MIYNPTHIKKYNIYDIFYNDIGQYIIICPAYKDYNFQLKISNIQSNTFYDLTKYKCRHKHTIVYCSEKLEYTEYVDILISDQEKSEKNELKNIKVNKYPIYENEILMSTIVKDEDNYICQWIEYHSFLGIDRFIIYDNSNKNTLSNVLKNYISSEKVILINWQYPYLLSYTGFSGQTTQQNHSIYCFKKAKYIGLFDIDEYVNPQQLYFYYDNDNKNNDKNIIDKIFDNYIFKNNINKNEIGGFMLLSKLFL